MIVFYFYIDNDNSCQNFKKYVKVNNNLNVVFDKQFDFFFNKVFKNGVDKGVFEQFKGFFGSIKFVKQKFEVKKVVVFKKFVVVKKVIIIVKKFVVIMVKKFVVVIVVKKVVFKKFVVLKKVVVFKKVFVVKVCYKG